jgi:hypothetical protein
VPRLYCILKGRRGLYLLVLKVAMPCVEVHPIYFTLQMPDWCSQHPPTCV